MTPSITDLNTQTAAASLTSHNQSCWGRRSNPRLRSSFVWVSGCFLSFCRCLAETDSCTCILKNMKRRQRYTWKHRTIRTKRSRCVHTCCHFQIRLQLMILPDIWTLNFCFWGAFRPWNLIEKTHSWPPTPSHLQLVPNTEPEPAAVVPGSVCYTSLPLQEVVLVPCTQSISLGEAISNSLETGTHLFQVVWSFLVCKIPPTSPHKAPGPAC